MSYLINGTTYQASDFADKGYASIWDAFWTDVLAHITNQFTATSTTSLTVGTGAQNLTITANKAFQATQPVRLARTSDPTNTYMDGVVTSITPSTGVCVITVAVAVGSGTHTDWTVSIGGARIAGASSPLTVAEGGTGAATAAEALSNLGGISAIGAARASVMKAESSNDIVHAVVFGPSLDRKKDWHIGYGSIVTSLMLATLEDGGADSIVNIYDLTASDLENATPIASVTITGAATPTRICAAAGYVAFGCEDGFKVIDPHDGSWKERTSGYPMSLSAATLGTDLSDNDVIDVAAGYSDLPHPDYRTDGPLPSFVIVYGTGSNAVSVYGDDGRLWERAAGGGGVGNLGAAITRGHALYAQNVTGDAVAGSQNKLSGVIGDAFDQLVTTRSDSTGFSFGCENGMAFRDGYGAYASSSGISFSILGTPVDGNQFYSFHAVKNRTYATGFMGHSNKGMWLTNGAGETDRNTVSANNLTKNGTPTTGAVASGAELTGYSGFAAGVNYTKGADADYTAIGNDSAYISIWMKSSGSSTAEDLISLQETGGTRYFAIQLWTSTNQARFMIEGSTAQINSLGGPDIEDGEWHRIDLVRVANDHHRGYVDGKEVYDTVTDSGSLTHANMQLGIGVNGGNGSSNPATTSTLALAKYETNAPNGDEIMRTYLLEKKMFEENAKALLQSGTTDAVLDVSIDPITGKIAATQTDDAVRFDGLSIDDEPALPENSTAWEHNFYVGDDRISITDGVLYADFAAKDIDQDLESLRGLLQDKPPEMDLSKAKAWVKYAISGNMEASYNVESITEESTGIITIRFAVHMASQHYLVIGMAAQGTGSPRIVGVYNEGSDQLPNKVSIKCVTDAGALTDPNKYYVAVFGETNAE